MSDPRHDLLPMHEAQHSFDVVLRGYDRSQVADTIERLEADFRIALADRDAAVARSADMAGQLSALHGEIESLRRKAATAIGPDVREHQRAHPAHAAARRGGGRRRSAAPPRSTRRPCASRPPPRSARCSSGTPPARPRSSACSPRPGRTPSRSRRRRSCAPTSWSPRRRSGSPGSTPSRRPAGPRSRRTSTSPSAPAAPRPPGSRRSASASPPRPPASGSPPPSSTPRSWSPRRRPRPRPSASIRDELTGRLLQARQLLDRAARPGRPAQQAERPTPSRPARRAGARDGPGRRRPSPRPQAGRRPRRAAARPPQPAADGRAGRAHAAGRRTPAPRRGRGRRRPAAAPRAAEPGHPPAADAAARRTGSTAAAGPAPPTQAIDQPGGPGASLSTRARHPAAARCWPAVAGSRCVLVGLAGVSRALAAAAAETTGRCCGSRTSPPTPRPSTSRWRPLPPGGGAAADRPGPGRRDRPRATATSAPYRRPRAGSYAVSVRPAGRRARTPPRPSPPGRRPRRRRPHRRAQPAGSPTSPCAPLPDDLIRAPGRAGAGARPRRGRRARPSVDVALTAARSLATGAAVRRGRAAVDGPGRAGDGRLGRTGAAPLPVDLRRRVGRAACWSSTPRTAASPCGSSSTPPGPPSCPSAPSRRAVAAPPARRSPCWPPAPAAALAAASRRGRRPRRRGRRRPWPPRARTRRSARPARPVPPPVAASPTRRARPRRPGRVPVPSVGIDTAAAPASGWTPTGALVPPPTTRSAGWFTGGPVPGDAGPAVLAGHVDSAAGPGRVLPAARRRRRRRGRWSTAPTARRVRFTVTRVAPLPQGRLPDRRGLRPDAARRSSG